jgi:parallel beta-helix repeat protein
MSVSGPYRWGVVGAAAVALLLGAGPAGAATGTLYVDRGSSACANTGSGTLDQPFCTISAAAARVTAGQTVEVAAGTYPEAVTVGASGTSSAPITFTAAPGATVTVSGQANGFALSGRSWVTIAGFSVTRTTSYGIAVADSSHITLSGNHVSYAGQPASGLTKSGVRLSNVTDSTVTANTVDHNTNYGIYFVAGSTRNTVRGNEMFSNAQGYQRAASGIRFYSSPGNTAIANVSHHNEDSGMEFDVSSGNSLVLDNVTYHNGDHGIDDRESPGQRLIGNTVYKNVTSGINVEGTSTGATLANNLAVDNGIASPRTHSNVRVETGSTAGTTLDYDQMFLSVADTMVIWDSQGYDSLSALRAATGQEAHGIQADPRWIDRAGGDFHLGAGSPAIDSANSGVSGEPSTDADGNGRFDDPDTLNTGAGPRLYDDRGAFEFQSGPPADRPPTAALSVTPASGSAPVDVTADASASFDGDATPIATYAFDWGDGTAAVPPQSSPTAGHTYTAAGTYTVTVTVTDTGGLASTMTASVEVTGPPADAAPAAALSVTPSSGTLDLAVTANASASTDTDATPIASYAFDFGDGSPIAGPQAGPTAPHTYTATGTYTVTVTVTDSGGQSSLATAQVTVTDAPPVAVLNLSSTSVAVGATLTADASQSSDTDRTGIAGYTFDFGDGTAPVGPQSQPTATHVYKTTGTVTVKVTVRDTAGLTSTAQRKVRVAKR